MLPAPPTPLWGHQSPHGPGRSDGMSGPQVSYQALVTLWPSCSRTKYRIQRQLSKAKACLHPGQQATALINLPGPWPHLHLIFDENPLSHQRVAEDTPSPKPTFLNQGVPDPSQSGRKGPNAGQNCTSATRGAMPRSRQP